MNEEVSNPTPKSRNESLAREWMLLQEMMEMTETVANRLKQIQR